MCHKLFQVYHCGHTSEICTTPCPHALLTAFLPRKPAPQLPLLTRQSSLSSIISLPLSNTPSPSPLLQPQRSHTTVTARSKRPPYPTTPPVFSTIELTPNFCTQFFARYLPPGNHPCYECYLKPEYRGLRERWMKMWKEIHPRVGMEDVERLSGIEGVREALKGRKGSKCDEQGRRKKATTQL